MAKSEPVIIPLEADASSLLGAIARADALSAKLVEQFSAAWQQADKDNNQAGRNIAAEALKNVDKYARATVAAQDNAAKKAVAAAQRKADAEKKAAAQSTIAWKEVGNVFIGGFSGGLAVVAAQGVAKAFGFVTGAVTDAAAATYDFFANAGTYADELRDRVGEGFVPESDYLALRRMEAGFNAVGDAAGRVGLAVAADFSPAIDKVLTMTVALGLAAYDTWTGYVDGLDSGLTAGSRFLSGLLFPAVHLTDALLKGIIYVREELGGPLPRDSALIQASELMTSTVDQINGYVENGVKAIGLGWVYSANALGDYMTKADELINAEDKDLAKKHTNKATTEKHKKTYFVEIDFADEDAELAAVQTAAERLAGTFQGIYDRIAKPPEIENGADLGRYIRAVTDDINQMGAAGASQGWIDELKRGLDEVAEVNLENLRTKYFKFMQEASAAGGATFAAIGGAGESAFQTIYEAAEAGGDAHAATLDTLWGLQKGFAVMSTVANGIIAVSRAMAEGGPFLGWTLAGTVATMIGGLVSAIGQISPSSSGAIAVGSGPSAMEAERGYYINGDPVRDENGTPTKGKSSSGGAARTTSGGGGAVYRGREIAAMMGDQVADGAPWTRKLGSGKRVGRAGLYGRG